MLPQNVQHGRQQNQQFYGDQHLPQDSSGGMYHNANLEKQMLALSAASLAKMANPSAPLNAPNRSALQSPSLGQQSGPNYFGGNSHPSETHVQQVSPHEFSNGFAHSASPMSSITPSSFPDHGQRPNPQQMLLHKRRQFLHGIATVMAQRGTPLPPQLTGVNHPSYDQNNSVWKMLEIAHGEPGVLRIAGKDVDLYRLWGIVFQNGGAMKFHQQGAWYNLLSPLELPDQLPPPAQGSTAQFIGQIYMNIIAPFEEAYRKNTQQQQMQKAAAAGRQISPSAPAQPMQQQQQPPQNRPGPSGSMGNTMPQFQLHGNTPNMNLVAQAMATNNMDSGLTNNGTPYQNAPTEPSTPRNLPQMMSQPSMDGRPGMPSHQSSESASTFSQQLHRPPSSNGPHAADIGIDTDGEHKKRKMSEEDDGKRTRQKTEPADLAIPSSAPESINGSASAPQGPAIPRTRRKITYVPLAREVETMGGRSMNTLGPELQRALQQRPLKSIHEWGTVEIDALIMSIRSRLSSELSYALTTCSLLSVVRDAAKDLPYMTVPQCPDLFEELLDLLEEVAFQGVEDVNNHEGATEPIVTMRELVNLIQEHESKPFASLEHSRHGVKDPDLGPKQRPGDIVLAVVNILRNWASACGENMEFMARHPTVLDIILRLSDLAPRTSDSTIRPASPVLSLSDLVTIRKDALYILFGITTEYRLKDVYDKSPANATRITSRIVELVSSSLMDPLETCVPSAHVTVPYMADNALQIWTRFSQPDDHRKIIAKVIPQDSLWQLFQALVYRLPMTPKDFEVITKDTWLTYIEKLMMGIYSLAFLAPPKLKHKFKTDKRLGFPSLMLRLVRKFTTNSNQNVREFFSVCVRRGIEAMKLIDDEGDMFDTAPTNDPGLSLSFGVGYGEMGEKGVQKGSGMFGGQAEDITFTIMLGKDVDSMMFSELESMVRVEF